MNGQQLQQGISLQPFNPLPMAGPVTPPADSNDTAPC
jgi:hypothetical protein